MLDKDDNATVAAGAAEAAVVRVALAGAILVLAADDEADADCCGFCCTVVRVVATEVGGSGGTLDESESGMRKSGVAGAECAADCDGSDDDTDDTDEGSAEDAVAGVAALRAVATLAAETFDSIEVVGVDLTLGDGKCNERATAGSGVSDDDDWDK